MSLFWLQTEKNEDLTLFKYGNLNDFFRKQDYSTLDREFDVIYVNGDNTLPNIKSDEEHWKVRLSNLVKAITAYHLCILDDREDRSRWYLRQEIL